MQQEAAFTLAFLLHTDVISATWHTAKPAFGKYVDALRCTVPEITEINTPTETLTLTYN